MDAVKFIKENYRMCHTRNDCVGCPIYEALDEKNGIGNCAEWANKNPEKTVEIVEKWSAEHPQKTMMLDFFEKFPNAPKNKFEIPLGCPYHCGYDSSPRRCDATPGECRECWNRILEEV